MYSDELGTLLELEQTLRGKIALLVAAADHPAGSSAPPGAAMAMADEAIAAWCDGGEEDQDMRAFRPLSPLQQALADHRMVIDRIVDLRDRRLS